MEEQGQVAQEGAGEKLDSVIEKAIARQEEQVQEHIATFGAEHAETLTMRSELAHSLWLAGRLDEAIEVESDILQITERTMGAEAPGTLRARENLAVSYWSAGRHDEAIRIEEEVL